MMRTPPPDPDASAGKRSGKKFKAIPEDRPAKELAEYLRALLQAAGISKMEKLARAGNCSIASLTTTMDGRYKKWPSIERWIKAYTALGLQLTQRESDQIKLLHEQAGLKDRQQKLALKADAALTSPTTALRPHAASPDAEVEVTAAGLPRRTAVPPPRLPEPRPVHFASAQDLKIYYAKTKAAAQQREKEQRERVAAIVAALGTEPRREHSMPRPRSVDPGGPIIFRGRAPVVGASVTDPPERDRRAATSTQLATTSERPVTPTSETTPVTPTPQPAEFPDPAEFVLATWPTPTPRLVRREYQMWWEESTRWARLWDHTYPYLLLTTGVGTMYLAVVGSFIPVLLLVILGMLAAFCIGGGVLALVIRLMCRLK